MTTEYRTYRASVSDSIEIRTSDEYLDRTHTIVPIVMLLGDMVLQSSNSDAPELVPARELARAPVGWNGRPVVGDHPSPEAGTANRPDILQSDSFGQVFNAEFSDNRLRGELWIDMDRANDIGGDAAFFATNLQKHIDGDEDAEPIEISTGLHAALESKSGTINGERYQRIWHDIVPDHVAVGLGGKKGACSVADGCGTPRVNQKGDTVHTMNLDIKVGATKMLKRFLNVFDRQNISDTELRNKLSTALDAAVPGFDWVVEVDPDEGLVTYNASPGGDFATFQQDFTRSDSDEIELSGEAREVELEISFSPVSASESMEEDETEEDETTQREDSSCRCQSEECQCQHSNPDSVSTISKGDSMSKDVLVQALIDCDKAPYTSENEDELRSLSEATLEATLDAFGSADEEEEDQTPNPDDASVTEAEDADPEPMTEEEWFAHAPESLRGLAESSNDIANIVNEHRQREQAERKDLITRVSEATDAYSAEALKGKTTEDLRSLAKALNVNKPAPDFSLQSETFDREPSENDVPEVRSMSERFAAN